MKSWYDGSTPKALLKPASRLYAQLQSRDRARKLARQIANRAELEALAHRPLIIALGNVNIGGTGKTPFAIALAELCRDAGLNTAFLSRGYGRRSKAKADLLAAEVTGAAARFGDEAALLYRQTGLPVAVANERMDGLRLLMEAMQEAQTYDCVICDDALQHYALPRDIEIGLVKESLGFGNGELLPAGPLRESKERLLACEYVAVNGTYRPQSPGNAADSYREIPAFLQGLVDPAKLLFARPQAVAFTQLATGQQKSLAEFAQFASEKAVLALAGIAHPNEFFRDLEAEGIPLAYRQAYADHHAYRAEDFSSASYDACDVIICTDKDRDKCLPFVDARWWSLSIALRLDSLSQRKLLQTIKARHKRLLSGDLGFVDRGIQQTT